MIKNIFSQILDQKRKAVAQLLADPLSRNLREHALEIRQQASRHRLLRALESDLGRVNIIAEFKRRSPSAGIIRNDLKASEIVSCYERGGAYAISILTDEEYFGGSIANLCRGRTHTRHPRFREDFIPRPH